jgi:hypothetical protein
MRAHVYGSPTATYNEMAESAGVLPKTAWTWTQRYPQFNQWLAAVMMVACRHAVQRVWRAVIARAESGSDRAAHMVLTRFDPGYAALVSKYAAKMVETLPAAATVPDDVMQRAVEIVEGAQPDGR